jgi:hypothetical protein
VDEGYLALQIGHWSIVIETALEMTNDRRPIHNDQICIRANKKPPVIDRGLNG